MGSQYDLCPKCGAVTKDGKCTSCGRLLIGKSSNSTMDKWRSESRQWQDYNRNAHQDHCDDHGADGNVYLNGKVIRKTSNYRDFSSSSFESPDSSRFSVREEDYSQGSSFSESGDDYSQGSSSENSQSSTVYESTPGTITNTTVTSTSVNGKAIVKRKRKKAGLIWWLFFVVIVVISQAAEESGGLSEMIDNVFDMIEDKIYDRNHDDSFMDEVSLYEETELDSDNLTIYPYPGSFVSFVKERPEIFDWVDNEPLKTVAYEADEELYQFSDYVAEGTNYDVYMGSFYYTNKENLYDEFSSCPKNVEAYMRYPILANTGLEEEDALNDIIYTISAECAQAYEWFNMDAEGENFSVNNYAYISYMDSDVLSILFMDYYFISPDFSMQNREYWGTRVRGMTIDMHTGEIISPLDDIELPENFGEIFINTFNSKSPEPLDYMTADEINQAITDGNYFAVYTPLGYEVCICANDYESWATCTFKDVDEMMGK